jgi:hypothetical protein
MEGGDIKKILDKKGAKNGKGRTKKGKYEV